MPNPIKLRATVSKVEAYGEGIYLVCMRPVSVKPRFKPGQFLHLSIDEYDPSGGFWPESRIFSIASSPSATEISIVYSVKGNYTKKMEKELEPGREVWLKMPYGAFTIVESIRAGQDVVLVAGGTGISPFLPFFEEKAYEEQANNRFRLYYGVRRNSMVLREDLLGQLEERKIAEIALYIEDEAPAEGRFSSLAVRRGCLNVYTIFEETRSLCEPVYFLSGPPRMIETFRSNLVELGVAADNVKIDEWE